MIANAALRIVGLALRFFLILYLAKVLTPAEFGTYGLIVGIVGMAPALIGWGINYFFNREVIGVARDEAARRLKDRLMVTLVSCTALAIAVAAGNLWMAWFPPAVVAWVALILVLECLCFDVQMALVSLGRAVLANVLLFMRGSAWALLFIGASLQEPSLQALQPLLVFWAFGLVVTTATIVVLMVRLKAMPPAWLDVDLGWVRHKFGQGRLMYVNDVALVSMLYLDRYIVNHFVGIEGVAVYTLYWAIANAVFLVAHAGVLQPSLRRLVKAHGAGGHPAVMAQLRREVSASVPLAVALALGVGLFCWLLLPRFGGPAFGGHELLMALLLLGVVAKVASETVNYGLYGLGLDRSLAAINISGGVLSLALGAALVAWVGLLGAAASGIVIPIVLVVLRLLVLLRSSNLPPHGTSA